MSSTTDSQPRPPGITLKRPGTSERLVHVRDLMRELIARDLKLRYRGSVLGVAWTLLNPIAELLVLLFVFDAVLPLDIPNYAVFLFTGLLAYSWFQTSLYMATGAIVSNRDLIRRPSVPAAVLPVVTVASTFLHFLFALPVLFALIVVSPIPITSTVLLLPVLMAIEFIVILSLAYPVATLHVWFRDTQYLLRVALQLLFYLTPVFYQASAVPGRFRGLYGLNPMTVLIEAYRDVLMRDRLPSAGPLIMVTLVFGGLLGIGLIMFRRTSFRFADEL